MPAIKLQSFDGFLPRRSDYLLEENQAQVADNVKLYSGEIRGWRAPVPIDPAPILVANPETIYRIERPTDQAEAWISFQTDVDIALSPIADTTDGRFYYTGDGAPKKSTFNLAVDGLGPYPFASLPLGVVAPITAPTLSETGGSGGLQTRVYVYTFISTFGSVKEESAPSPPTSIDAHPVGATVTVSDLGTTSPMGYNITHKRIYRTIGGSTGIDYRLVAEIPIAQATYTDTIDDVNVPGDPIISIDFTEPPPELKGLQVVTGGFLVGFKDNEVWFSEPFFPHAWPAKYVLTTEFRIVGIGVVGGLVVALTERFPEIIYGTAPGALGQEKIPLNEPCASKRSIATDGQAVLYASPNGFVAIGPGIRQRFTDRLFRREEFQAYNPPSMYGRVYDGTYFVYFNSVQEGTGALLVNSTDIPSLSRLNDFSTAAFVNTRTASMFYVPISDDATILEFDADLVEYVQYRWRSKKFDLPFPSNLGVIQVYADYGFLDEDVFDPAADIAYNEALITPTISDTFSISFDFVGDGYISFLPTDGVLGALNTITYNELSSDPRVVYSYNSTNLYLTRRASEERFVSVSVFGDGRLVATNTFTNERHIKLPAGRKYRSVEIEIQGNTPIYSVSVATTAAELKEV